MTAFLFPRRTDASGNRETRVLPGPATESLTRNLRLYLSFSFLEGGVRENPPDFVFWDTPFERQGDGELG